MAIPQHLVEKLRSIPQCPGIYKMLDSKGNILYIGKSKSLNSRVKSYFTTQQEWSKLKRLVFHINDIDYIVTDTHLEAQILECALIKKLKPQYNAQFKNDNKYIYFKLNTECKLPSIAITEARDGELCFGPYRSKGIITEMINSLERLFPIVIINGEFSFDYRILPETIDKELYHTNSKALTQIFTQAEAKNSFIALLEVSMRQAATNQQFERAQYYRDLIYYINYAFDRKAEINGEVTLGEFLIGVKLASSFKLFYILDNRLVLKRKLEEISTDTLKSFINEGRRKITKQADINEKRALDFKHIVGAEINITSDKVVLVLKKRLSTSELQDFLDKLITP